MSQETVDSRETDLDNDLSATGADDAHDVLLRVAEEAERLGGGGQDLLVERVLLGQRDDVLDRAVGHHLGDVGRVRGQQRRHVHHVLGQLLVVRVRQRRLHHLLELARLDQRRAALLVLAHAQQAGRRRRHQRIALLAGRHLGRRLERRVQRVVSCKHSNESGSRHKQGKLTALLEQLVKVGVDQRQLRQHVDGSHQLAQVGRSAGFGQSLQQTKVTSLWADVNTSVPRRCRRPP